MKLFHRSQCIGGLLLFFLKIHSGLEVTSVVQYTEIGSPTEKASNILGYIFRINVTTQAMYLTVQGRWTVLSTIDGP